LILGAFKQDDDETRQFFARTPDLFQFELISLPQIFPSVSNIVPSSTRGELFLDCLFERNVSE
ncbi:hypothetical protein BLOT_011953, partial [Blomia tropicalis]